MSGCIGQTAPEKQGKTSESLKKRQKVFAVQKLYLPLQPFSRWFAVRQRLQRLFKGGYQSGQMGQTVNLLAHAFGGSNPSPPTAKEGKPRSHCGSSSVDRALAFQAGGRAFEPRLPLNVRNETCCCSSVVEHFLGKEEVTSSILVNSSTDAGWWLATKRNSNNRSFNNHL